MAELVQKKDYLEAAKLYGTEKGWFAENMDDPEVNQLLDSLAISLAPTYEQPLMKSLASIREINWPTQQSAWPHDKELLQKAETNLQRIAAVPLFKNPQYRLPVVDEAKRELAAIEKRIVDYAPTAFSAYPILRDKSFFAVYPVGLNEASFISEHKDYFEAAMAKASGKELLHLNAEYADFLSPDTRKFLAEAYFKYLCPDVKRADLGTLIDAYGKALDAGLQLDSIPGVKIAFMEVTSDTLKKKGGIEFPVGVELDMPFAAVNESLNKGFESEAVKQSDILILFNLAATKTDRRVDTSNSVKSTYLAGYNKVNNPEWDVLQVELQQANMEIMLASKNELSTNTGNAYTDFGNALVNWGNEMEVDEAKEKLEELKKKVRETPRYLDEPVYEPYRFKRVEMEVLKAGSVQYYIIDQRSKRYFADFFDVQSKEFFTVAYNLMDSDPDLDKHSSTNVTEEMVDTFENDPISVKLSELLNHYSRSKSKTQRYTSLAAIREDVMKNRNVAIAQMKETEYGFDKRDDKRFESVVVVNSSDGLGTGFYVAEDMVLTNYHVVEEQKFIEMKKWNDVETFGKVVAKDVRLDLALIKVQDRGRPVAFYSGKNLKLGESVDAIGHPHGKHFTLTRGIVSTLREHATIMGVKGKPVLFVQTDTPINPGNSGGPLFLGDYVIGVNDWGVSKEIAEGLNFSIHYSEVFKFLNDNNIAYKKGK